MPKNLQHYVLYEQSSELGQLNLEDQIMCTTPTFTSYSSTFCPVITIPLDMNNYIHTKSVNPIGFITEVLLCYKPAFSI